MRRRQAIPAIAVPSASDWALTELTRRLVETYQPERVYLFGSVARGDAGADSDYDLVIVVPDSMPRHFLSEDRGYRCLRGIGIAADILVWTKTDFEKQLHLKASFPSTVLREGKLLYGAA